MPYKVKFMKELVVISGKGGTGKTVLSGSFAALADNCVIADTDVDAANLYILLQPQVLSTTSFCGGKEAILDPDKCTACGECVSVCRFDAIRGSEIPEISAYSCEGCGLCSRICPTGAIRMEDRESGKLFISSTAYGPFVHARLGIAQENSGKLVSQVRINATRKGKEENAEVVIIDGPPGIGCPAIASLSGTDLALVVTEPSLSGLHDLIRVIETTRFFRTKPACCINKWDISPELSDTIEDWCADNTVPFLGKIPYDHSVFQSLKDGKPFVLQSDGEAARSIREIWDNIKDILNLGSHNHEKNNS
jgi:MinD superfamily P-loop ATPase